ncbi:unnamed protein product [Ranitomeya imitator]|uniref:SAP domain-containing protein n=1 Tax=Ranitomeya imitator TaxID=111125 RepID=A0ABN9LTB2_9NEOB|nr:unnamed protein product [Ranitomeya imitator]
MGQKRYLMGSEKSKLVRCLAERCNSFEIAKLLKRDHRTIKRFMSNSQQGRKKLVGQKRRKITAHELRKIKREAAKMPFATTVAIFQCCNVTGVTKSTMCAILRDMAKQNHSKPCHDKVQRPKKIKDAKPKVKKLKYHQYIPPDQKQKESPGMDSSYAKILQQQQLFLQLQILNQQQQHYNYQAILPAPPKPLHDQPTTAGTTATAVRTLPTVSISTHCASVGFKQNITPISATKTGPLPSNLDDMKRKSKKKQTLHTYLPLSVPGAVLCTPPVLAVSVGQPESRAVTSPLCSQPVQEECREAQRRGQTAVAELKQELKLRGLHVSGTKVDLIERLKATQEICTDPAHPKPVSVQQPKPSEGISRKPNVCPSPSVAEPFSLCGLSSTPPCSPCPSEVSVASAEDVLPAGDSSAETVTSPVTQLIFLPSPAPVIEKPSTDVKDKDDMLQEKDRQIEELTRRLKQKQELVERLKQQLQQEKRTQPPPLSDDHQTLSVQLKQEIGQVTSDSSGCMETSSTRATLKPETTNLQKSQFFISSACKNDRSKSGGLCEAQLVLAVNRPNIPHGEDTKSFILQVALLYCNNIAALSACELEAERNLQMAVIRRAESGHHTGDSCKISSGGRVIFQLAILVFLACWKLWDAEEAPPCR